MERASGGAGMRVRASARLGTRRPQVRFLSSMQSYVVVSIAGQRRGQSASTLF